MKGQKDDIYKCTYYLDAQDMYEIKLKSYQKPKIVRLCACPSACNVQTASPSLILNQCGIEIYVQYSSENCKSKIDY